MVTITTATNIQRARLFALKGALSLELQGLKRRGRSVYAIVKSEFGFHGNKQRVYTQLVDYIAEGESNEK